jgi:hypothetical protein
MFWKPRANPAEVTTERDVPPSALECALESRDTYPLSIPYPRPVFEYAFERIQELYLAKRKDEAVAAVPDEFCDEMALVGPAARIRERYRAWADCGITGLTITTEQTEAMELMAQLAR